MACPFPGMDPYLEAAELWSHFQHHLIAALHSALLPSLDDRYRLRVGTRSYVNEQVLLVSVIREEQREEYLEIRQRANGKLITQVDVVSPANRTTAVGRKEYRAKRQEARKAGAHLVEIDLVLQGDTVLDISADGLPEWDYAVCVGRAQQPDRYEIYTTTLQKRLPRFRLPLASDHQDEVMDLQKLFSRCYDQFFAGNIDYRKDPPALLDDANKNWMHLLLRQMKLRS